MQVKEIYIDMDIEFATKKKYQILFLGGPSAPTYSTI